MGKAQEEWRARRVANFAYWQLIQAESMTKQADGTAFTR